MQIILNPTGTGACASTSQTPEGGDWAISIPVRIEEPMHVKLATGGDLVNLEGRAFIKRRLSTASGVPFVGKIMHHEAVAADVDVPSCPEEFTVTLYVSSEVFEDALRLCAMDKLPKLILIFSTDEIGDNLEIIPKTSNGLTYENEHVPDDIDWDNKEYKSVGIKSVHLSFPFMSAAVTTVNDTENLNDPTSEAETIATLPMTRQQMTMLIHMVRNVGIGLGILAVILHFLR